MEHKVIVMKIISTILIGIIQGLLEWLPISSSGQISIILMKLLNINPSEAFQISLTLHIGTALTSIIIFRNIIFENINVKIKNRRLKDPVFLIIFLSPPFSLLTGLPAFLILEQYLKKLNIEIFASIIGFFLIITGLIQLKRKNEGYAYKEISFLNIRDVFLLGLIQGLSIIPGISRSAVTISCLLALRYNGEDAFTISFIASIPLSLAAGVYGLTKNFTLESTLGILSSLLTGLVSIKAMLTLSRKLKFPLLLIALGLIMILQLAILTS